MTNLLSAVNSMVWGAPALVLILGVGIYLSLKLDFPQAALFPRALEAFLRRMIPGRDRDGDSSFRCLCTALAATVGTGNLVGVAGALCLGGPGAIFWMWICGLLGMAVKYAEATLSVRYRKSAGESWVGGPMYMMLRGMGQKWRPMAVCYCLCGLVASCGVGNAAQVNAVITSLHSAMSAFGLSASGTGDLFFGIALGILTGALLLGGARRIGDAAQALVPLLSGLYILMCAGILIFRASALPGALAAIVTGAFSPGAVTGGMLGSAFQALRIGCSRGVFTNEAGMGTAAIAHAPARVAHPAEQGLMGIMEVFLDTIVICTLTALAILCSGVPVPYGRDAGAELTNAAFSAVYGAGASTVLALALCCFAIATILGWGLYGGECARFLFGQKAWGWFVAVQMAVTVLASVLDTALVWQLSELFNGLMTIPNLITLAALTPELCRLTKEYKKTNGKPVRGGYYADFHQCQPL